MKVDVSSDSRPASVVDRKPEERPLEGRRIAEHGESPAHIHVTNSVRATTMTVILEGILTHPDYPR